MGQLNEMNVLKRNITDLLSSKVSRLAQNATVSSPIDAMESWLVLSRNQRLLLSLVGRECSDE